MKKFIWLSAFCLLNSTCIFAQQSTIAQKVKKLLQQMTLEEKIGQMNQYSSDFATGPISPAGLRQEDIRQGKIGSFLNVTGAARTRALQQMAMQSRLKIPLLFALDVIHGYRTTFPIPLAEAASWDIQAITQTARIAATETAATGVHWVFAPMVDIARDARWGRVMEGAGEDAWLGAQVAAARVKGFQGSGLGHTNAVMACAKHFAAYGAAVGGRDYNSVDMSLEQLHNVYLPPFKAAAKAGAASFMNAFNDLNGIPATGNAYLQNTLLKKQWQFSGLVVSDWGSVGEMVNHGYAGDSVAAALLAANAGCDIDMESRCYTQFLPALVQQGKVKMSAIDDAVSRILRKKFEMGLFDDPYKFCNEEREQQQWNLPTNLQAARSMAQKSIVLLQNHKQVLPLQHSGKTIALIGPLVKAVKEHLGFWSFDWPDDTARISSLWDAMQAAVNNNTKLVYAKGCGIADSSTAQFAEAVHTAQNADIVVVYVGEDRAMTGEARSRSQIRLPGVQEQLIQALVATGKPVVLLIGAGRPLVFAEAAKGVAAIAYTWWLGTTAGHAITDVLLGKYNPSAKLPISFPRHEGQIPIYYNHFNTGRPAQHDSDMNYVSAYTDLPNSPQYAFGYGLSYTQFAYSLPTINKAVIPVNGQCRISTTITNTGQYDGEETVQLYIRDWQASLVRPVKELKGFKKIFLKKGEFAQVEFTIDSSLLGFYNAAGQYLVEPGLFSIMVGGSSDNLKAVKLLVK
jgi:beta-glucosidase